MAGTTVYPGAIDTTTLEQDKTNATLELDDHPTHHNDLAAALLAVETELGVNPSGASFSTVAARLADIEGDIGAIGGGTVDAAARADIVIIKEAPLNAKNYGLVPGGNGTDAAQEINAALVAADGSHGEVLVPPGSYTIRTPLVMKNRATLVNNGEIRVDPTLASPLAEAITMDLGTNVQGFGGGITGRGRFLCNRKATTFLRMDCWRWAEFKSFEVCDPIDNGFYVENTATSILDNDSHLWDHVFMRNDPGAGIAVGLRPKRFVVFDAQPVGGANRIISDCKIRDCQVVNGLMPGTAPGYTDGGFAVEMIDAQRIKVSDLMVSDNTREYGGAVKIRATNTSVRNSEGHAIESIYIEAGAGAQTGWINRGVYVIAESGTASQILYLTMEQMRYNTASGSSGKRLHAVSNAGAAKIRFMDFLAPQTLLTAADQIILGTGVVDSHIETRTPGEITNGFVDTTGANSNTNKVVSMGGP